MTATAATVDRTTEPDEAFRARVAVLEAAPDAAEALRVRIAETLYVGWHGPDAIPFAEQESGWRGVFLAQADRALAVIREEARR